MTYHEHRKLWQQIPAYILITDFCLYDFISFFFSFFFLVISFFSFKPWSWFLDDVNQLKVTCQLENDTCTSRDVVFIIDEAAATAITTPSISQTDETQQFNEDVSCVLQSYYVYRHQEKKTQHSIRGERYTDFLNYGQSQCEHEMWNHSKLT